MCAIIGALVASNEQAAAQILAQIWGASHQRGRDGRGYFAQFEEPKGRGHEVVGHYERSVKRSTGEPLHMPDKGKLRTFIANLRAEPTTEFVAEKKLEDQQPYTACRWSIVHNGTIANDKDLRVEGDNRVNTLIDSAAIAENLNAQSGVSFADFCQGVSELKGSYAILAAQVGHTDKLYAACNYRPIWYVEVPGVGVFFASARDYLPQQWAPRMLLPYTAAEFVLVGGALQATTVELRKPSNKSQPQALVVCSGGLDSVVAATYAQRILAMKVTLLHFHYGSRAQDPETKAIEAVAAALGCELIYQQIGVYRKEDSPLLQSDSKIAGGEAGAEFAYEWVPARNLLMLSMATAIAEARGIETVVLGNNLEEAGAYPDNEPEFIARFNDLLPFAVGDGKRMQVIMPVGNMMKHEIVELGLRIGAPLHLTWSCYRANEKDYDQAVGHRSHSKYLHCGTCGPCYMRRRAFEINDVPEVIQYGNDHGRTV